MRMTLMVMLHSDGDGVDDGMIRMMSSQGLSETGNKKPVHFKNFLNQLFQENVCIQDIPIKHQESRILVKQQDLAQPLGDDDSSLSFVAQGEVESSEKYKRNIGNRVTLTLVL